MILFWGRKAPLPVNKDLKLVVQITARRCKNLLYLWYIPEKK